MNNMVSAGGAITQMYGRSSAASTAVSIADALKSLVTPTPQGDCFSSAVCTDGNPYGIAEGLIFSMPCRSKVLFASALIVLDAYMTCQEQGRSTLSG